MNQVDIYSLDLSLLIYRKSLEIEIHMPTLLPFWQPPRQSLPRVILVEDLCKLTKVGRNVVHIHQIKVGPT